MLAEGLTDYDHDLYLLTKSTKPVKRPAVGALMRLPALRGKARRHDLVHVHGPGAMLMAFPALRGRPAVFTTHGLHLLSSATPRSPIAASGLRRALADGVQVIAVSTSDRDALLSAAPELADSTTVVLNGLDVEPPPSDARSRLRGEWGLADSTVALLFISEFADHKQPLQFVDAVEAARERGADVAGFLVGDGPLRPELDARAGDGITVLGPRQDVNALLAASDVYVLLALHDGLGLSLLEAMASGRAVIATDIAPNREPLADTAVLVPVGDDEAVTAAIVELAADSDLRDRLGDATRRRAIEEFSLERMLRETEAVYERALPGSSN
jgi:glycosyltransferase involved in cell wall biosynthesis